MTNFEDQLWSELTLAQRTMPHEDGRSSYQARRRRAPRGRLAAAGVIALGGAAVAVAFSVAAGPTAPAALAVVQNPDGSITLTLNEIVGVSTANRDLANLGVRVRLARVEAGCTATGELIPPASYGHQRQEEMVESQSSSSGELSSLVWTIHPSAIPSGDTLLIAAQVIAGSSVPAVASTTSLYRGAAPVCQSPGENYPG
jgi:hypothetical protein